MGTRGSIGLTFDGKTIHTYNHFDSYPTGLGIDVLGFVRDTLATEAGIEAVLKKARALKLVDEQATPTAAQARSLSRKGLSDVTVSEGDDWYATLRNAQGQYQSYLDAGYWPDNPSFYRDYVFCEWSYIVDLDDKTVRIEKAGDVLMRWAFNEIPDVASTPSILQTTEESAYS